MKIESKRTKSTKKTSKSINKDQTKPKSEELPPAHIYAWGEIPITPVIIEKWVKELDEWVVGNPNAKTITEFIFSKGLTLTSYRNLRLKHATLAQAHEKAMTRLGERLWGNAVDNKANWHATRFMIHNYGAEFDEAGKRDTLMKEKIAAAGGVKVVEIPAFEDFKKDKK